MGEMKTLKFPGYSEPMEIVDAKARESISKLSDEIANLQTSGLTTAQINALDGLFKIGAYTEDASAAYAAFKTAFGISDSEGGEPEKILTGISATYSGGDVPVGTALSELTGIVVTATYSDGSTQILTDYTLSGTIAEGENVITVTYKDMTTTFTVVGDPNISPYALANGTHTFDDGTTVTVTNGSHVSITINSKLGNPGASIVLSDVTQNSQSFVVDNAYNPQSTWFSLATGDDVSVSYENFVNSSSPTDTAMGFKKTGSSSSVSALSLTYPNTSKTAKIAEDVEVGNLFIYFGSTAVGDTVEFDVSVTVNGVKYV